jgi:hypothetical protein
MSCCLYARILGPAWRELDARLRGFLESRGASGAFLVRRGTGLISRTIGWTLRLPRAGADIPIRLIVEKSGDGETWRREIGAATFVTDQFAIGEGLLAERFGLLEFRLRVEADVTTVRFRQLGAALVLGALRLPLPRYLSPCVEALMHVEANEPSPRVSVVLIAPLAGLLLAYQGPIMESA